MTALTGGVGTPTKARLIVDSSIYTSILTEELWGRLWPERTNGMPQLEESNVRLIPYGSSKSLELLGTVRCLIKAEAGQR